ncbi:hypothetical protein RND71_034588 [Anisodus tanguticus]|uniref:Uncharacterized protein n=1 Tax=Anisodus tanguticus TaxID=243964 RepID=A0AAE1V4C9_9SOLA|nr:hypothetical protein RND71_034588 [Anisodus tanguticus]
MKCQLVYRSWTALIEKIGKLKQPFTRQENTVIRVLASSGIAFRSGTTSYMLGISPYIVSQADAGNTPNNTKKLTIGWTLPYLLVVCFAGLFSIVALRKSVHVYVIGVIINIGGQFTLQDMKQVGSLFKTFGGSFIFAAVEWIFAREEGRGFGSIPTFGPQAYAKR